MKIKAQRFQTALPPTTSHSFRKFLEGSVSCDHHQHGPQLRRRLSAPLRLSLAVRPEEEAGAAELHLLPSILDSTLTHFRRITTNTEAFTDERLHKL